MPAGQELLCTVFLLQDLSLLAGEQTLEHTYAETRTHKQAHVRMRAHARTHVHSLHALSWVLTAQFHEPPDLERLNSIFGHRGQVQKRHFPFPY